MARRPKRQGVILPSHSLVASSARYSGSVARIYRPSQGWQAECYRHFEICGEARFAARFFGHALAKATLKVSKKTADGWDDLKTGPEFEDLEALFNGKDGQAQMLESIGVHLTVAGECFLVGRTVKDENGLTIDDEIWEIVSIMEMKVTGTRWSISYGDNITPVVLTDDDAVIRIWLSHPAKRIEADSPFRSLLPILTEIEWATKHIFSQMSSRLAGAGILILPLEVTFPPPPPVEGKEQTLSGNDAVDFMKTLGHHMLTPINDPSNPAALVPIVLMCPGEAIEKIQHLTFWTALDEKAMEMRRDAIQRFAVGMDLPPEQVLGMASNRGTGGGSSNGVSHWGAWQIEEATIKMFIEPMLDLVCNALTISYIRKLRTTTVVVRSDTAALKLRPDRSKEARELNAAGKLSDRKMLEENGFDPGDAMDDVEYRKWLLTKLASGSATPDMVNVALKLLGIDLKVPLTGDANAAPALPSGPAISDEQRPRTPDPAESEAGMSVDRLVLLAACEALTLQGLARAGNRMRSGKNAPTVGDCPAYAVHTMVSINGKADFALEDAFPSAELVLEGIADHKQVVPVLTSYCKSLFASQEPHTRENLQKYLEAGVTT